MRRFQVEGPVALVLLLAGLALAVAAGAGAADVIKHGRADLGAGLASDPYKQLRCRGRLTGCQTILGVHIRVDRSGVVIPVPSDELYRLVGPGSVPVRLKLDTVTHRISDVQARGRWYVTYSSNRSLLFLVIPLFVVGLVCIAVSIAGVLRGLGRRIVARRRGWRWVWVIAGSALFAFCVALGVVGVQGDRYDIGRGELHDRYATNNSLGYLEGVHVRVDRYGTDEKVESRDLFTLAEPGARVPVELTEDGAGRIATVTYGGTTYVVQPSSLIALVLVVPAGLFGLALAWRNGRALRAARPGATAAGL